MMLPNFLARSEINRSKKLDIPSSLEVRSVNGVAGALHSSNDWSKELDTSSSYEVRSVNGVVCSLQSSSDRISLKTHRMTLTTIL